MADRRPNILLITADDLNWNSVGSYGCKTPDCTPNIDALAADGVRFNYGHVTIAVCQPSRGALMTGRYPHNSEQEGFHYINHRPDIALLPEVLAGGGYVTGIIGKAWHSTPRPACKWDLYEDMEDLGWGRDAELYYKNTCRLMEMSREQGKPFFLMANSHDPHRPFHGNDAALQGDKGITYPPPSKVYSPEEVQVPGFLPDIPEVRREIAEYSSSVRRCDDTVGRVIDALKEAGVYENTLTMFLSDNGMAFPFSKTNCYLHSTKTPWIAVWPGVVEAGTSDEEHFINGIDFMPTVLEAAGVECPDGMDGSSFLPVLRGDKDPSRNLIFTQFHQTANRRRYPMRCVQDKRFGYIFNPWSDGERVFKNESQAGRTFAAMKKAGRSDNGIAARVELFVHRVVEEFYDFANDPDALNNLVDDPAYAEDLNRLRSELEAWMVEQGDSALEAFRNRTSGDALNSYMHEQELHGRELTEKGNRDPEQ